MALIAPRRSLRSRALQLLAQREHSRAELTRKLTAHALAEERSEDRNDTAPDAREQAHRAAARVEAELDWLERQGHLSPERFVESRVHARAARFGNLRIRQELAQHRLELPAEAAGALHASEFERACGVLARKYKTPPSDAADRARRARFLVGRGFSAEVVRRAVRASSAAAADASEPDDDV